MNAVMTYAAKSAPTSELAFGLRVFVREASSEFLRLLRAPSFCVPTIAFPLMFYVLFGIVFVPAHEHPESARHAFVNFMVFGCMASGLFALAITLSADRERGILRLKQAMPVPSGVYLAAKMAMAMVFAAIVTVLLMALALGTGAAGLTVGRLALSLLVAVLGVLPFCAIGLFVGSLAPVSGTPALVNLIYLPMSFLSGLWLPLSMLPTALARLAPLWPSWHLLQIGRAITGDSFSGGILGHVLALAAILAAFCLAAARVLSRAR